MIDRLEGLARRALSSLQGTVAGRWYAAQSPRDQRVVLLLAGFVAAVLLWLLVWVPVRDALASAERRHAAALADHRWIVANADQARRAAALRGGSGGARSGQALLSTVANSARSAGLTLNRFQPEGNDALAVSLDDVRFEDLLPWLETLGSKEGIRVRQATVDGRDEPGHVRARLVLY